MTTTADPVSPVVAVVDDDRDLFGWVMGRSAHHHSCVGIQIGVADRQAMSAIGDATLAAIGKDPWLSVSKRPAELLAAAWLSTGGTTDLLIGYAQLISDWLVPELIRWCCGLGVRPWLIYTHHNNTEQITAKAVAVAADWGVDVVDDDDLYRAWPDTAQQPEQGTALGLPRLPRVDGLVFRSTCRDRLPAENFATVDDEFTAEVALLRAAITKFGPKRVPHRYENLIQPRLADAADTEQLVLRARAAQVAGVTAGIRTVVDTTKLLGAATLPRPGLAGPQHWWPALRRYRDPDPGAVAALYNAGVHPEDIPAITIADVAEHAGTVTVTAADTAIEVGGPSAEFLVVLRRLRQLAGATGDDYLFATHRKGAVTNQFVSKMLWSPANDTGVRAAAPQAKRRHSEPRQWLGRYGVTVNVDASVVRR